MPLMCWLTCEHRNNYNFSKARYCPVVHLSQWNDYSNSMKKNNNSSLWEIKKYREPTVTCAEAGWKAQIYPVEVRWMDFVRESTPQLPKPLRVPGSEQKKTLKDHSRKGASGCDSEEMIWSGEIKDLRTSRKQQWTIDYCDCELQWHPGMTGGQSGKTY